MATLNLGALGFDLTLNKSGWNKNWGEANRDMDGQSGKFKAFASGVGNMLKAGIAAGAMAAGAAIVAMTKMGIDNAKVLNKSMSEFSAHTGVTGDEAEKVKGIVKELYKVNEDSYEDLVATAEALHNNMGMNADDIGKYAQNYLNYAKGTKQGNADAVAAIDDLGDAWGLTSDQSVSAMDMILVMNQKYGASVTDTQAALTKMAPAAKAAGYSMEESAAFLAMFAASGVDANTAATAFTKAVQKVKSPEQMAQALAEGSISVEDFIRQMEGAGGAVTAASDAYDNNFDTRMALLQKKFGGMATEIGEKLLPMMEGLMGWAEAHMPQFEAAVSVAFEAIGQVIDWFMQNVWPSLQAVLNAIWSAFQTIWPSIQLIVQKAFSVISSLFKTIGALLRGDWSAAWGHFKDLLSGVCDFWITLFTEAWNTIDSLTGGALTRMKDAITGAWEAITQKTTEVWTGITDWFKRTFGWIGDLFKGIHWSFPSISIPDALKTAFDTVSGWWEAVKTWFVGLVWSLPKLSIPEGAQAVIDTIGGWAADALSWFKGLSFNLPGVTQPITGKQIVDTVKGWAEDALNWFKGLSFKIPGVEQPVTGAQIIEKVRGWAADALTWFQNLSFGLPEVTLPTSGQDVIDTVAGWWESAKGWFTGLSWSLPELTTPGWVTTIGDAITGFVGKITGAFDGIQAAINAVWPPRISMPHFTVTGSMNPIDWFSQGVPSIDVSWYAKGGIFSSPTLFATPFGAKGVGEAGAEAVLPLSTLWSEMSSRFERALEKSRYEGNPIDYGRIERTLRKNPVVLAIDGQEMAVAMVDRNELAIGSREFDIAYGYGGG